MSKEFVGIKIEEKTLEKINQKADRDGLSKSEIIRSAIKKDFFQFRKEIMISAYMQEKSLSNNYNILNKILGGTKKREYFEFLPRGKKSCE